MSKKETPNAEQAAPEASPAPRVIAPFPEEEPAYARPVLETVRIVGPCGEEPCA